MKWLDNWILNRDDAQVSVDRAERGLSIYKESASIGSSRHRMNFTVYRANGGVLVEINRYDERKDQHHCELHIVHPDENLGEALGKIVTFESLKS